MPEPSPAEIAVDSFLDGLLRGHADDVEAFLAAHPELGPEQVARVRKLARVLGRGGDARPAGAALPFERLGPYRLLERLGAGGMGIVFVAEDERLGRRVALKVLRPELAGSGEAAARFEREARAVARLKHAHIVTVYEAGRSGDVAYLAMELVPGKSLDELLLEARLARRPLPLADLLAFGRDVARALAAAHAVGVVHRDVKPSNVRITPEGTALLLDFGLALDPDSATISRSGAVQGTLAYVSPEQIAGGGAKVDARTDVWSLGVTLYEGLTGNRPFAGEHAQELLHQILTREPVPPRTLVPALPRDVETVVLKALEKDRGRRYASAAELADELDALLEGRPVRARPTGVATRVYKWSKRKPAHASTVALAALLVVGGPLALALVQARHARALGHERDVAAEQRDIAAEQRDIARDQRALAEERAGDLEELVMFQGEAIGAIEPPEMAAHLLAALREEARAAWMAEGLAAAEVEERLARMDALLAGVNTTNVAVAALRADLLEPSIARARERFAERPKVQGMLLHTIAATCWELGLAELALETQRASYDVLVAHAPPDDRDRLVSTANLGQYLASAGRSAEAEPLLASAADGLARLHGGEDSRVLAARQNLALLLHSLGRADEAEALVREVLATRRRVLGDDDPETLASLSTLGGMLFLRARLDEAEPFMQEALARRTALFGAGDPATLASANNLAVLYRKLGRAADAERVLRDSLAGARASLGDRHGTTNHLRVNLAEVLQLGGHPDEAEELLRESVAAYRETSGELHADTLRAVTRLGDVLRQHGRPEDAAELLGPVYEAARAALGPQDPLVRPLAELLAGVLRELGLSEEALAIEADAR
jgi:tetratricopeptide (TPR) repeat protein